jgi:hypothetical protein
MLFTELLWLRKPSLMKPRNIPTKDDRTVQDIRRFAKEHVGSFPLEEKCPEY